MGRSFSMRLWYGSTIRACVTYGHVWDRVSCGGGREKQRISRITVRSARFLLSLLSHHKKINYRHNFTHHSSLTVVRLPHRMLRDHDSKQDLCLKRGKFFLAPRLGFNRCTTSPFGLPKLGWKWLKTLFWLKCYERKTLFRLKKEAEQAGYKISRTGPTCHLSPSAHRK